MLWRAPGFDSTLGRVCRGTRNLPGDQNPRMESRCRLLCWLMCPEAQGTAVPYPGPSIPPIPLSLQILHHSWSLDLM